MHGRMAQQMLHDARPVSAQQAADTLEVDKSTITRWVKSGQLKSLGKAGDSSLSQLIFDPREVERLRAQRAGEIGDVLDRVDINAAGASEFEERSAYRRQCYLHAIRIVAARTGGTFYAGQLRAFLPEDAAGPEAGALVTALVRRKVIEHTGKYADSRDARNRHGSTPCKVYRVIGELA